MNKTLLIPALFPPFGLDQMVRLPALELILARGSWSPLAGQAVVEDWIVTPAQTLARSLNLEHGHWFYADPAHVRLEGSRALLMDAGQLSLADQEANALVTSLNRHFEREGLRFHVISPTQWLMQSQSPLSLETSWPPLWCAGRSLEYWLPTGAQQSLWRQRFNEVQMVLFEHPVNQQRAKNGLPTVDALWFWNRETTHLPQPHLLDALRRPAAYEDVEGWLQALLDLDRTLTPLLGALRRGELESLTLICPEGQLNTTIHLKRRALRWHFWKTTRPMAHYHAQSQLQNR